VIKFNIAWRTICTLGVVWLLGGSALAQSVLNFTSRGSAGIGITNTSPYAADVKFTLYNADGSLATGVLNPVSRRVPGKGQISVFPTQIFRIKDAPRGDTWVQASSPVTGLDGFYFGGNSAASFEVEPATPLTIQAIPYVQSTARSTSLILTNPASQTANVMVTFYDAVGGVVRAWTSPLPAHAQVVLPAFGVSARVSADVGILATALQDPGKSAVLINGQGGRSQGLRLVAPHFRNNANTQSLLVLSNPTAARALARVSFFTKSGGQPNAVTVSIPGNGTAVVDRQAISSLSNTLEDGWLLVESNSPLSGLVLVNSEAGRAALPLQSGPMDRALFSRFIDGGEFMSSLSLVGNAERDAVVTITLNRPDGTAVARNDVPVPPLFKVSGNIRDLVPIPEDFSKGFISIQSTAAIYGLEFIDVNGNASEAGIGPRRLARGFQAPPVVGTPRILKVDVFDSPEGIRRLKIIGENIDNSPTALVGGRSVPLTPVSASGGEYTADLPALEPGFINVKVRTGGLESESYSLGIYPDQAEFVPRSGQALFQKVEVTDNGLDLSRTVMVPVRNARVEVVDRASGQVVSVSETDEEGEFVAAVPDRPGLTIRVLSRLRSADVKILDNFTGRLYAMTRDVDDAKDLSDIDIIDTSRTSGAFNILDAVQRGNALVAQADSQLVPPALTIYWNEKNNDAVLARLTGGYIRTTFFNLATNSAYVLGDRSTDSDEFDDSVILHEYAHMLAARFSRDDSPGGPHVLGDTLDPRVAWSEGWANFFSSAARGTSVYLDSKGPGVSLRYDLEENVPAGDRQGYWSETSVHGLLWDLLDDNPDAGDNVQLPFSSIWSAFTDLRNDRFVYLPYFLEHLMARNPTLSDALRPIVVLRNIDFQPDVRPSVVLPFPRPMNVGTISGEVDSFTPKRTNLAISAHFYRFTTSAGGQARISLDIDGLGPANNPNANDLDLFLYDANGKKLDQSDNVNSPHEEISWIHLAPGTYYVEVRSFYVPAGTNTPVLNSGHYRLQLQVQ
jgi:Bacterial pre-peptidase C-terminal domain